MIEHGRYVPLRPIPWSKSEVAAAIEDIVADGLEHFDAEQFWPAHPLHEGIREGHTSLYFGATGVVWGIDYLGRVSATKAQFNFRLVLPRLLEAYQVEFAKWNTRRMDRCCLATLGRRSWSCDSTRLPRSPTGSVRGLTRTRPCRCVS